MHAFRAALSVSSNTSLIHHDASYPSPLIQTDLSDFVVIKKSMRFHQLSLPLLLSVFVLGQFPNTSVYGWFCLVQVRNRNIAQAIYS